MKKLLTFFCLILISFYSYSEEVSENQLVERQGITYKVNSTTPFNGTSVEYSRYGGSLEYIRNYKNGELDGPYEKYYREGQLERRENYKNGKLDGLYEWFKINGDFNYRGNYKNGERDGLFEDYGKNSMYIRENYKDGERDGLYEEFHCQRYPFEDNCSSQLKYKKNYKEGREDGLQEEFFDNGQLKEKRNIENGELVLHQTFDREGNPFMDLIYINGNKTGTEVTINFSKVTSKVNHKNGELDGLSEWYFTNGQLRYRQNYKNGKPEDGPYEKYYDNGQFQDKGNYKNGELDGTRERYHKNGQLLGKVNYKYGMRDGLWEIYHPNGQLEYRKNYKYGREEGLWEIYHPTGQLKYRKNYKNGKPEDGPYERYYPNGKLSWVGNYKNGELVGPLVFYYQGSTGDRVKTHGGYDSNMVWYENYPVNEKGMFPSYDDKRKEGLWE